MNLKPKFVFGVVKVFGIITTVWPTNLRKKSVKNVFQEFRWCIAFLNVTCLLLPLFLGVYHHRHKPVLMMKTLSELTALGEVFFNLILCKIQRPRFLVLLNEVDEFIKSAKGEEKIILHKYVNRYLLFHGLVGLSYFQTAIAFSFEPLLTTSIVPADAWYIFTFKVHSPTHILIYSQQVLAIIQTGMNIIVDFIVALLLAYITSRMEILNLEFRNISNLKQLNSCIKKHQHYIKFTDELTLAVRFIILKSNVTMAMAAVFGAFPLIYHEPLPVISKFLLMVLGGCLRLYVTAWPADDLREMSERIAWSVYNSMWFSGSKKMKKSIAIVIQRAQKPLVISVHGILPALTLKFYASFLSSTVSYFMTLRAILDK